MYILSPYVFVKSPCLALNTSQISNSSHEDLKLIDDPSTGFQTRNKASIPWLPEVTQDRFQSMASRPVWRSSQCEVQHLCNFGR